MTTDEQLLEYTEDDPDCGVDAASDIGYWLEESDKDTADDLISRRKEVGLSPELLSQLAPIPLEEYLLIEKGERTMTNGDAWRIDAAIIDYRLSKETWFQRSWKRGWLSRYRYKLRVIWKSDTGGLIITAAVVATLYYGFLREYLAQSDDIFAHFLRSALNVGIPICILVSLGPWIVRELRKME